MKISTTGRTVFHQEVIRLTCALAVFLLALIPSLVGAQQAHYSQTKIGALSAFLPDPVATPGLARPDATKAQLCAASFRTGKYRKTTASMKARSYATYGVKEKKNLCCEVDHLISLELGGADDPKNLWPQPYSPAPGAHEKDLVENYLHRQVCAGAISLADAQREISSNWLKVFAAMKAAK
jgi:hypothetical protein